MSGANPIPPVIDPDLRALLQLLRSEILYGFNCHQIGTIQSFNATKQTATVSLNFLRVVPSQVPADTTQPNIPTQKLVAYPLLVDVPVFVNGGGSGVITFPITAGDTCMVLFNDRDIDGWFSTGQVAAPNSARAHDLADGLALIGFRSLSNPIAGYPASDVAISYNGGQILVNTKIGIANASGSMYALLTALITALTGWVDTRGDTPNPATLTALNAVQTKITALLK